MRQLSTKAGEISYINSVQMRDDFCQGALVAR
jgi:hypothetical protein